MRYFSCRITSKRVCEFKDVIFLDIVDLDENPNNVLVVAKLNDGEDDAPQATTRGRFRQRTGAGVINLGYNKKDEIHVCPHNIVKKVVKILKERMIESGMAGRPADVEARKRDVEIQELKESQKKVLEAIGELSNTMKK